MDCPRERKDKISSAFLTHAKAHFLKDNELEAFVSACCRPLRKSIRVNTLKIDVSDFVKILDKYDITYSPIPWCEEGFWLEIDGLELDQNKIKKGGSKTSPGGDKEQSLGNFPEHLQGLFYIQEASSMLPPKALLPPKASLDGVFSCQDEEQCFPDPPLMILDMAAAPGSKTTQLAALTSNKGLILANEMSASRVKVLHANLVRCGVFNTCISQFDGRKLGQRLNGVFDCVLLDAPCGGEGTVRKDENALRDWDLSKVQEIARLQKELIETAYQCLKPGGRLVYSTCTLSPEENQQVALHLVAVTDAKIEPLNQLFDGAEKCVTEEGFLHVLPHLYDSEGFFVALFIKPETAPIEKYAPTELSPFLPIDRKTDQRISQYYLSHYGVDFTQLDLVMKCRGKEIWLFPNQIDQVNGKVRLNRSGIKLAEIYPNKIRSTHEFVCCFGRLVLKQKVELEAVQAAEFYKGRNLNLSNNLSPGLNSLIDGDVILTLNHFVIGLGELKKGQLKNRLPRDLVRDHIQF